MNKTSRILKRIPWFIGVMFFAASPTQAVTFDSGSNGQDGVLEFTNDIDCVINPTDVFVDVGESGIKQYSSINIESNCNVIFTPRGNGPTRSSNPVRLIVEGDVVVDGSLDLSGDDDLANQTTTPLLGGSGGPGGYDSAPCWQMDNTTHRGFGPSDNSTLIPRPSNAADQILIGGTGARTRCDVNNIDIGPGGGGAILIASSGTITLNGIIDVSKGNNSTTGQGSAAGGMAYLIANIITGSGIDHVVGDSRFIIEALNHSGLINNEVVPLQQLTLNINQTVAPTIEITEIDGQVVTQGEDLILSTAGNVQVRIDTTGLEGDSEIVVRATGTGVETITTAILQASGLAFANVDIAAGFNDISAYLTLPLIQVAALEPFEGEVIQFARLETTLNGKSQLRFYTKSGKRVPDGFIKDPWSKVSLKG